MRKLAIALVLVILSSAPGFSQQQRLGDQERKQPLRRGTATPPRRAAIEELVLAFYINQFPQVAEVSDEVFVKVLPFLREFIQNRFETSNRRRRALNQLRMVIDSGGSDDDIRRWMREIDSADAEIQTIQREFMSNVDPLLNTRQQAQLRIYLDMSDQRIRQMINGLQNAPANRQNAAPADSQKQ